MSKENPLISLFKSCSTSSKHQLKSSSVPNDESTSSKRPKICYFEHLRKSSFEILDRPAISKVSENCGGDLIK